MTASHHHPHPGDVGRRVRRRREELGMSRAELAARAGMVEGYVAYLEEEPAQLGSGELLQLAAALQLMPSALLGSGADVPPGRGEAAARPALEMLDDDECWTLIGDRGIGRIALFADDEKAPVVLPLNYATAGHELYVETLVGNVVHSTIERSGGQCTASFEIDRIDDALRTGWSVLLRGDASIADSTAAASHPWIGTEGTAAVRVHPHEVTGRRIVNG
jgi:transcriptional regulator with XRE-family HTH domain